MSIAVMTNVWKYSKASGTDLLILLALADNANDEGECWPSIRYVAGKCRIDARTTQRRIRSLETLGEVIVIRGGGRASTAGGTKSNRYVIIVHIPDEEGGGDLPGSGTSAGDGAARVPPEPSFESSMNRHSLAPTAVDAKKRDSLKRKTIEECRWSEPLTLSAAGELGKAVKEIEGVGGSANGVGGFVPSIGAVRKQPPTLLVNVVSGDQFVISHAWPSGPVRHPGPHMRPRGQVRARP